MKIPSKEFFGQMLLSMFGGGVLGPIGAVFAIQYDKFWFELGLCIGTCIGSIIGCLIWKYGSMVRNRIMRAQLSIVMLGYFLGGITLLFTLISGLPFRFSFDIFSDPDFVVIYGASVTAFVFASVLSIIPFLIYKRIQSLAVKK